MAGCVGNGLRCGMFYNKIDDLILHWVQVTRWTIYDYRVVLGDALNLLSPSVFPDVKVISSSFLGRQKNDMECMVLF